jgi:hypothetical protein
MRDHREQENRRDEYEGLDVAQVVIAEGFVAERVKLAWCGEHRFR